MDGGRQERLMKNFIRTADENTNLLLDIGRITKVFNEEAILFITIVQHKNHLPVNRNKLKYRILGAAIKISNNPERNKQFIGLILTHVQKMRDENGMIYKKIIIDSQIIDFSSFKNNSHENTEYELRAIAKTLVCLGQHLVKDHLATSNANCFEVIMNPTSSFTLEGFLKHPKGLEKVEEQNYYLNKKISLVLNCMKIVDEDFVKNYFMITNSDVTATAHAMILYQGSDEMRIGYKYIWGARDTSAPTYLIHKAQLYACCLSAKGLLVPFTKKFKHGQTLDNDKILDEPPQFPSCVQALKYYGRSGQLRSMDNQHHRYMSNGEARPLSAEITNAPYKNDVVMFDQDPIPGPSNVSHSCNPILLDGSQFQNKPQHVCNSNMIPVRSTNGHHTSGEKDVNVHSSKKLTREQLTAALRQTVSTMNTAVSDEMPTEPLATAENQLNEIKLYNNNFKEFAIKVIEINSNMTLEQNKLVEKFEALKTSNMQENKDETNALQAKLKLMQDEQEVLSLSNTEMSSKIKVLEENNKFYTRENEILEERNDAYKKRLKSQASQSKDEEVHQQDKWRLENEITILKDHVKSLSEENKQVKQKMARLERENDEASQKAEKEAQKQEKLRLENEVNIMKDHAKVLTEENEQLKQKMLTLEHSESLSEECQQLKQKIVRLESEKAELSAENRQIQQENIKLLAVHSENTKLINDINIQERKYRTKDERCNELTAENDGLNDDMNNLYSKINTLEQTIENLKGSKEENTTATITKLQKTIEVQEDQITDYQNTIVITNELKMKYDDIIAHLPKTYDLQNIDLDDTSSVRARLAEQQGTTNGYLTFVTQLINILVIQKDDITGLMLVKLIIQNLVENESLVPYISAPKVESIKKGLSEINHLLFPQNGQITQIDGNTEAGPSTVKKRKK